MKKIISILSFCFIFLFTACDESQIADTQEGVEKSTTFELLSFVAEEAYPGEGEIVKFENGTEFRFIENVGYIFGGDMILTEEQAVFFDQNPNGEANPQTRGSILTGNRFKWSTRSPIEYYIGDDNNGLRQKVLDAISVWESQTQLKFKRLSYSEYHDKFTSDFYGYVSPFLYFKSGNGSSSPLGQRDPGPNVITLDENSSTFGTAIHEIGHSIGLIHEHQSFIRDNQLIIHTNNILSNKMHNFSKETLSHSVYGGVDFYSIMLYPSYNSFAINQSQPTMTAKAGVYIPPSRQTGINNNTWTVQRQFLSVNDRWAVAGVYGYYFNVEDHNFEPGGRFWE